MNMIREKSEASSQESSARKKNVVSHGPAHTSPSFESENQSLESGEENIKIRNDNGKAKRKYSKKHKKKKTKKPIEFDYSQTMMASTSTVKKNKYSQIMMDQLLKTDDMQSIKDQKAKQRYFTTKVQREEFEEYCEQKLARQNEKTKNKLENLLSQAKTSLHCESK